MIFMVKKQLLSLLIITTLLCGLVGCFFNPDNYVQAQTSHILGYSGVGVNLVSIENLITGSLVYMPISSSIENITVQIISYAAGANSLTAAKCAVYKHSDLSLVATTAERTSLSLAYGSQTLTFTFASSIALQGGTEYILAFWGTADVPIDTYVGGTGSGSNGHTESLPYAASFPDPLVPVADSYTYTIYTVYSDNVAVTSNPAVGADVTINGTAYSTPAYFSLSDGNHTFTAENSLVYGDSAYIFANWTVNGTDVYTTQSVTLNITAPTNLTSAYSVYSAGLFHFYGPYNETSGLLLNENVTVIVHYNDAPNYEFILNGTWLYPPDYNVMFFEFIFSDNSTRQYWIDPSEVLTSIYVFKVDVPEVYTINFLDYTGVLQTYPYVAIQAYVNGTLFTVEKRMVDEQNTLLATLLEGSKYTLVIGNEANSFVYGEYTATASTAVQLILRGVDLPKESLMKFKYLTFYAYRDFSSSSILFYYNDSKADTTSLTVSFWTSDGVPAYNVTYTGVNTVTLNWTSAVNSTAYQVIVTATHGLYGEVEWRQYLLGEFGVGPAMFDFSFLGTWSFDLTYLFAAIIILFIAGCFSALNAEVGAVLVVIFAVLLSAMGWIPIPVGSLVAAGAFAILMALVYNKRRVGVY